MLCLQLSHGMPSESGFLPDSYSSSHRTTAPARSVGPLAAEIEGMVTRNFSKYRDGTGYYWQLMLCSFDQVQPKALALGGCYQAGAGCIDLLQVLVADAFEPEEPASKLRMMTQPAYNLRNCAAQFFRKILPAILPNDDEVGIHSAAPKLFKGCYGL